MPKKIRIIRKPKIESKNGPLDGFVYVHPIARVLSGKKPVIYISDESKKEEHLEILCHECAHLYLPDHTEEFIEEFAATLANLLKEQGYTRNGSKK